MKDPEKTLAAIGAANDTKIYPAMIYIESSTKYIEKTIVDYLEHTVGHAITAEQEDNLRTAFFAIRNALDVLNDGNVEITRQLLLYAEPEGAKEL